MTKSDNKMDFMEREGQASPHMVDIVMSDHDDYSTKNPLPQDNTSKNGRTRATFYPNDTVQV